MSDILPIAAGDEGRSCHAWGVARAFKGHFVMNITLLMRSAMVSILGGATIAGAADAGVLVYEYAGNPMSADEADSEAYREFALEEGLDPDEFADTTIGGLNYSVTIDEALLPAGTVRGQTVTEADVEFEEGFVRPTDFISFELSFGGAGRVIDWGYSDFDEIDGASSSPSGDSYEDNLEYLGFFDPSGDSYFAWSNNDPGSWERVSGDLAPIPTPAALPLVLTGVGALALFSRRRGARTSGRPT